MRECILCRFAAIILGKTSRSFGAGMSCGISHVLEVSALFLDNCDLELIDNRYVVEEAEIVG
jgi:glutamate synthase domain-containing protein 3